jgi:hypothetical protein
MWCQRLQYICYGSAALNATVLQTTSVFLEIWLPCSTCRKAQQQTHGRAGSKRDNLPATDITITVLPSWPPYLLSPTVGDMACGAALLHLGTLRLPPLLTQNGVNDGDMMTACQTSTEHCHTSHARPWLSG